MRIKALNLNNILLRFLIWRIKHLGNRPFVLILAGLVGVFAGLAAVVLKESVHSIQNFLIRGFDVQYANYFYLAYPLIGIFASVLVARFIFKDQLGHGIPQVLYSISKNSGIIRKGRMISRMVASALTVGFGGSVGLEAPIVVTGSAIGSNVGQVMRLGYKKRSLLIGCGTAGAISGIFNSPIAGVIFAIEVILADVTIGNFIPLLIASVFGALVSLTLLGDDILFSFSIVDQFKAADVPFYMLLGGVCGLVSVYFTRMTYKVETRIQKVSSIYQRAILGGILLGILIFVFPPIYGEGYDTIKMLLSGESAGILNNSLFFEELENIYIILIFTIGIILIKPVASALTIGAGGSGGVFAPSLFLGGLTGFLLAEILNLLLPEVGISYSNFILVGMCGIMSGILRAPLTAIFLIAEITSGYELFVPLMLVSAMAYTASSIFEKYSLYTKKLVESGDLIQYDRDRQVLSRINLEKIVEKDLYTVDPEATLEVLIAKVRKSRRNIFPVVNKQQELVGIVTLDDIREIMFDEHSQKNTLVETLMNPPPTFVGPHENMQSVMSKFEITGAWNLPVIKEGKYVGFVSKSTIFNTYRKELIKQHQE